VTRLGGRAVEPFSWPGPATSAEAMARVTCAVTGASFRSTWASRSTRSPPPTRASAASSSVTRCSRSATRSGAARSWVVEAAWSRRVARVRTEPAGASPALPPLRSSPARCWRPPAWRRPAGARARRGRISSPRPARAGRRRRSRAARRGRCPPPAGRAVGGRELERVLRRAEPDAPGQSAGSEQGRAVELARKLGLDLERNLDHARVGPRRQLQAEHAAILRRIHGLAQRAHG